VLSRKPTGGFTRRLLPAARAPSRGGLHRSPGRARARAAAGGPRPRAHLRSRHHLTLTASSALARAFPHVPLLAQASAELAVLAEMAADDAAARRHDPGDLAAALVILARAGVRAAALTASGPAATARIHRLLAPPRGRGGRPGPPGWLPAPQRSCSPAAIAFLPVIAVACDVAGRP